MDRRLLGSSDPGPYAQRTRPGRGVLLLLAGGLIVAAAIVGGEIASAVDDGLSARRVAGGLAAILGGGAGLVALMNAPVPPGAVTSDPDWARRAGPSCLIAFIVSGIALLSSEVDAAASLDPMLPAYSPRTGIIASVAALGWLCTLTTSLWERPRFLVMTRRSLVARDE